MKISFLGDSITFGYGLENKENRYSSILCKSLGAEEANYGITGTLLARAGMNRNDGKSFLDRLNLVLDGDFTRPYLACRADSKSNFISYMTILPLWTGWDDDVMDFWSNIQHI